MKRQELIPYLVQTFITEESFKQKYPNIEIFFIAPGIYKVLIPNNDQNIIKQIQKRCRKY